MRLLGAKDTAPATGRARSTRSTDVLGTNPFLRAEVEVEDPSQTPALEEDPLLLGDAVMEAGPRAPLHAEATGLSPVTSGPLQVWGLHGGAGASTITALLDDAGAEVIDAGRWTPQAAVQGPCLVVATTRGAGLAAVKVFATAWHAGELPEAAVLGVALVDDAPHQPKAMKKAAPGASGVLPRLWRFPWSEDLRMVASPTGECPLPWRTRLSIKSIHRTYRSL